MIDQIKNARRAAVPVLAIETADQQALTREIASKINGNAPVMNWDLVRGLVGLNELGQRSVYAMTNTNRPEEIQGMTTAPASFLGIVIAAPEKAVIIMQNGALFLKAEDVQQGIQNIRDVFKGTGATLIMLSPMFTLPQTLEQDVMILTEKLPDTEAIKAIASGIIADAGVNTEVNLERITDILVGLSAFSAEQTLAVCIRKDGESISVNMTALWERKCQAVEQTPGLSIWRGTESFDDVGGCENVKKFTRRLVKGKKNPLAIVFIDEIEKAMAGSSSDSSGVTQDQHGVILKYMQDTKSTGMIFIGPPGAAKSAVAKAAGNTAGIPTIAMDIGGMKDSLVGSTGARTRNALKVISAISQGRVLFIATCNSIGAVSPELQRRFTSGTFFFDLPSIEERQSIWTIYRGKYETTGDIPDDNGWTGAEIETCCRLSDHLGIDLIEAATYIVPVCKSAADKIDGLRKMASGVFLDASKPGVYSNATTTPGVTGRKFS